MPWTTCRVRPTTTVCANCAGSTRGESCTRRGRTCRPGWPNGRASTPSCANWAEGNIEETLSFYRLPLAHHKHLKSTNMLERLNEEIKRRTQVVRIFPNE